MQVNFRPLTQKERETYALKCAATLPNRMQCPKVIAVAKEVSNYGQADMTHYYCAAHGLEAKQVAENAALRESDNYGLKPEHAAQALDEGELIEEAKLAEDKAKAKKAEDEAEKVD